MKKIIYIYLILICVFTSCSEDWISDIVPTNQTEVTGPFKSIKDAQNAVNGVLSTMLYTRRKGVDYYCTTNTIIYGDLKGIDVKSSKLGIRKAMMYSYTETTEANTGSDLFTAPYISLASINSSISRLKETPALTEEEQTLKSEVEANLYALRALNHFNLLRVYSRIPTAVSDANVEMGVVIADKVIKKNEQPTRATLTESYDFVVSDLTKAIELMPKTSKTEGWFSKDAVKALLARVYLYYGKNQLAYDKAEEVINSSNYSLLDYTEYASSWKGSTTNKETLFELINTDEDNEEREGIGYLWSPEGYNVMHLTKKFMDLLNQDNNDIRLKVVGKDGDNFYCNKYPEQYATRLRLIRLSEVYFIAAEAAIKIQKKSEATKLLNIIIEKRTKAANKLQDTDISITKLLEEKRKEFVGEGHTFFDLIRNKINIERSNAEAGVPAKIPYNDYRTIQPIPRFELNVNNNIKQNPEYAK